MKFRLKLKIWCTIFFFIISKLLVVQEFFESKNFLPVVFDTYFGKRKILQTIGTIIRIDLWDKEFDIWKENCVPGNSRLILFNVMKSCSKIDWMDFWKISLKKNWEILILRGFSKLLFFSKKSELLIPHDLVQLSFFWHSRIDWIEELTSDFRAIFFD